MWDYAFVFAQESAPLVEPLLPLAQGGANPQSGAPLGGGLLFMVLIFGVMWLFLILPNQRREKERRKMLGSLGKGDKVVTSGGIYGTIVGLSDKTVVLRVSDDPPTKIEFARAAVAQVSSKEAGDDSK